MNTLQRRQAQAILGLAARYRLIPATTGVPAVGVVITSGAGAWGAQVDIAAAGAIAAEFWIVGFYVNTGDTNPVYEIQVSDATPTVLTEARIQPTVMATPNLGLLPAGAYPIRMAPGSQVQGRTGGAAAKVLGVSMLYGVGL